MTNLDTPMSRREWLLLALFFAVAIYALSEFHQYLSNRVSPPVVLNSLPATKIKCRPGAIEGLCANDEYAKNWEAMQK